ncbi:MAG: RMD1 family protein [Microscillaceae bacterium]|nr:RMD1 family protein [Microscillaceae bacterium]
MIINSLHNFLPIFLLGLLLGLSYPMWAQGNGDTEAIIRQYLQTLDKINQKQLFCNENTININRLRWNNNIKYQRQEKFYYSINPDKQADLHFLQVRIDSLGGEYQIEYLFDNQGDMIYCRERKSNFREKYGELETFFRQGILIQWQEDKKIILSSTLTQSHRLHYFQQSASHYQQKFRFLMNQLTDKF